MTTLLIDGDITLYQVASKCEVTTEWDENLFTLHSDLNEGVKVFNDEINKMCDALGTNDYIICLTGTKNYRKNIFPDYKANRKSKRKPLILHPLREYVEDHHRTHCEDNLEADDLLGLFSQTNKDSIVVSLDKDLKTVPCRLSTDGEEVVTISKDEARMHFYTQCLTGDSTDNYNGCPGIGPAKAAKLLEDTDNYWATIVEAYTKVGLTEADALVQAQLAYILRRRKDYNFKTHKVNPWQPKKVA